MYETFAVLGCSFILWAIGRLFLNLSLYREDKGKDDFINTALTGIAFFFFFFGLPASLIITLIWSYPKKRIWDGGYKEGRKRERELAETDIRCAVAEERDRLNALHAHRLEIEREIIRDEESARYHKRYLFFNEQLLSSSDTPEPPEDDPPSPG